MQYEISHARTSRQYEGTVGGVASRNDGDDFDIDEDADDDSDDEN